MLSGFGEVSKDCPGNELEMWSQVLADWDKQIATTSNSTLSAYSSYSLEPPLLPKNLPNLVRSVGVPEALRGEVWQRMTGASSQQEEIIETYKILLTKESPDDKVILRDIHRTFPAHDFFKESGGVGQESLYRIAKAYSVYDSEIGYCQGQSFLIAALLLQMPEEQAFGVLVKIMHNHGLRDMFRENFEQLQLRLYQLDRLIEATMPVMFRDGIVHLECINASESILAFSLFPSIEVAICIISYSSPLLEDDSLILALVIFVEVFFDSAIILSSLFEIS